MHLPRMAPAALALVSGRAELVFPQCDVDALAVLGVARRPRLLLGSAKGVGGGGHGQPPP